MRKVAFAVMTAALLGACSSRNDEGAAQDSAAAGAAVGTGGVSDSVGGTAGSMGDTAGGTMGTTGTGTSADTARRDSTTTPPR